MENMEIPERRSATIYIDGDAIPRELKEAVYRAAERTRIPAVLVANSFQRIPASALVRLEVTGSGFDAADNRIVELARAGDLVITSDIPLADRVLAKGAQAFNSHGELFTPANIKTRLARCDAGPAGRRRGHRRPRPLFSETQRKIPESAQPPADRRREEVIPPWERASGSACRESRNCRGETPCLRRKKRAK